MQVNEWESESFRKHTKSNYNEQNSDVRNGDYTKSTNILK